MVIWFSKKDMKAVLTETFIKNIVLVDDSEYAPGRTRFWHDLQEFISVHDQSRDQCMIAT